MKRPELTAAILADNSDLRAVEWKDLGMGQSVAHLKFKRYTWAVLAPLRAKAIERARRVIEANKETDEMILVAVLG